jgi:hypothetical protein
MTLLIDTRQIYTYPSKFYKIVYESWCLLSKETQFPSWRYVQTFYNVCASPTENHTGIGNCVDQSAYYFLHRCFNLFYFKSVLFNLWQEYLAPQDSPSIRIYPWPGGRYRIHIDCCISCLVLLWEQFQPMARQNINRFENPELKWNNWRDSLPVFI